MDYLPIFLQVRGQRCIVIGGGEVAARKVALLEKAGASIAIVSPVLGETLREACNDGRVEHLATTFVPQHLTGAKLVIAATGRKEVNQAVAVAARERNVPVNVVDDPTNCEFIMPAIVDRSPLVVAISSAGQAPVLARRIREKIETMLPAKFGLFVEWAGSLRSKVAGRLPESRRRWFWERLMDSPAVERIIADDIDGAADIAALILEQDHAPGHVSLVGAGPGDPDLLTLKALRALQTADVIVHDRLVSAPVLDLARRDAERINVGKAMNRH